LAPVARLTKRELGVLQVLSTEPRRLRRRPDSTSASARSEATSRASLPSSACILGPRPWRSLSDTGSFLFMKTPFERPTIARRLTPIRAPAPTAPVADLRPRQSFQARKNVPVRTSQARPRSFIACPHVLPNIGDDAKSGADNDSPSQDSVGRQAEGIRGAFGGERSRGRSSSAVRRGLSRDPSEASSPAEPAGGR
jgi:hypothetical protein